MVKFHLRPAVWVFWVYQSALTFSKVVFQVYITTIVPCSIPNLLVCLQWLDRTWWKFHTRGKKPCRFQIWYQNRCVRPPTQTTFKPTWVYTLLIVGTLENMADDTYILIWLSTSHPIRWSWWAVMREPKMKISSETMNIWSQSVGALEVISYVNLNVKCSVGLALLVW